VLEYLFPRVPPALLAAPNAAGSTPLHWAALNKQMAAAQALVGWKDGPGAALVDARNAAGHSPLGEAENAGWDDGARWLVSVMDLSRAGEPTEGTAGDDVVEEGDVKIAAKVVGEGKPVTVEITDSEGRMASMTLDDLKNVKVCRQLPIQKVR
jgi:ankyrin repeat protein